MNNINNIRSEFEGLIANADDMDSLEQIRISVFGKKGQITALMRELSKLDPEKRKTRGKSLIP